MSTDSKLSTKIIRKVVFISILLISTLAIGVRATKNEVKYVTIVFPEGYESTVMTTKVKVADILSENHTLLLPDETVTPDVESNIDVTKKITISKKDEKPVTVAEKIEDVTTEEILGTYVTITEKIITEQVEIPYETVTKDVSAQGTETQDKVIQEGENGLKEIKYRAKYKGDEEIERTMISETVIKEPKEKIVQISTKVTSRGGSRTGANLAASVDGMTPTVVTMNTSAYCSCARCCGKSNGITSSGAHATEWCTVAAGSG